MKKLIIIIAILVASSFLNINIVSAQDWGQGELLQGIATKSGYQTGNESTQFSTKVGQIINITLSLVGIIFFALTVYAGFLWMTASGNDEQVTKATSIMKMAVIGLIIALSAYSITWFITGRATGLAGSTTGPTVGGANGAGSFCAQQGKETMSGFTGWVDSWNSGYSCSGTGDGEVCCITRD